MTDKKNNIIGIICALVPNIIFGFSFLFSKTALLYAHPLIVLAVRFTVAFLIFSLLIATKIVKVDFKGKDIRKVLLMSLMQPLLYFFFELYGLNGTSSALSGIITSLVPIGVIVLSAVVLKEKPTLIQTVCSCISVLAVAIVSVMDGNSGENRILPVIMLFCAVCCSATFNILSRSEAEKFTATERTYMMFAVGAVGFNVIAIVALRENFVFELTKACSNAGFWGAICYLVIASSIFAFLLYNYATTKIDAVRASSFSNIITVVSVLAGTVILKEPLSIMQAVLCAVIVLSVWGANRVKKP